MEILPGVGIGNIKYGISEQTLIQIFGTPDRIEETEYVDGSGDWHRVLWYSHQNINFTFNKDDNYRLGTVTILGSGYHLFGKDIFNAPKSLVRKLVLSKSNEVLLVKDHTIIDSIPHESMDSDKLGIIFWFDSDNLTEMQCSYLFESDNETEIWP